MTGLYGLDVFQSPYNSLVKNELNPKDGKAFYAFCKSYDIADSINNLLNIHNEKYIENDILDKLKDTIDYIMEDLCIHTMFKGYYIGYAKSCSHVIPLKRIRVKREIFSAMTLLHANCNSHSKEYAAILKTIEKKMLNNTITKLLQELKIAVYSELQTMSTVAFNHGKLLGQRKYPV